MIRFLVVALVLLNSLVVANAHTEGKDANSSKVAGIFECLPSSCSSTWTTWNAGKKGYGYDTPCSVASGNIPTSLHLPLYFPGNFQLCRTFDTAHYCRIDAENVVIPSIKNPGAFLVGGPFRLDQCVSQKCHPDLLKQQIAHEVDKLSVQLSQLEESPDIATEKDAYYMTENKRNIFQGIMDQIKITCYPTEVSKPDIYGILMLVFWYGSAALTIIATVLATKLPHWKVSQLKIVKIYNGKANAEKLMAATPGDFSALNGFRFFSMCWVITGHAVLVSQMVVNPTAIARLLQSFEFVFIRGAFFAVDTFFFMSGFLAAWGLLRELNKRGLSWQMYLKAVVGRYLRLTPAYFIVIVTAWKVLPHQTVMPLDLVMTENCEDYFWTNMIYLNNIIPWGNADTQKECAGWTWYLANDFQFFLLAPFIVQIFLVGLRKNSRLLKYLPCFVLILVQVISTAVVTANLAGPSDPRWGDRIYVKPWQRVTPYAIGMLLAFIHYQREVSPSFNGSIQGLLSTSADNAHWKILPFPIWLVNAIYIGCIALMFSSFAVIYQEYKCTASTHDCEVWYGQFLYGYFKSDNWSKLTTSLYYGFSFLWWTLPLAAFCYILFCDSKYDMLDIKSFMSHSIFAPLARLTYNAYLVHIPLMIIKVSLDPYLPDWHVYGMTLQVIGYIFLAYFSSFIIFLLVEKPAMNILKEILSPSKTKAEEAALLRRMSSFSDPDNENFALMENSDETEDSYQPLAANS